MAEIISLDSIRKKLAGSDENEEAPADKKTLWRSKYEVVQHEGHIEEGVLELRIDRDRFIQSEEMGEEDFPHMASYDGKTKSVHIVEGICDIRVRLVPLSLHLMDWYRDNCGIRNMFKNKYRKETPGTLLLGEFHNRGIVKYFELWDDFGFVLHTLRQEGMITRRLYRILAEVSDSLVATQKNIRKYRRIQAIMFEKIKDRIEGSE